jgi:dTDP-4-dehydrorhamnose reductase
MRILLTGVTGQVGSARFVPRSPIRHGRCRPIAASWICRSPRRCSRALDRLKPDLIVNPAAYTAVDLAEDERELAFRVNADAPAAMAHLGRPPRCAGAAFLHRLCV